MKFKKIFLLICLLICLFSMASVCAGDTAMASEDTGLELSVDNEMEDNLQTNEETPALAAGDNDETVSVESNSEILSENQYSYSDLREQIGSGGNKNLAKGTYTYKENDGDTIEITDSGVIDGNGAVIDMAGSNIQAFIVNAKGVTIKNLTIKNAKSDSGSAIKCYDIHCIAINCTFTGNTANYDGGACDAVTAINCNFTNNHADYNGGAIRGFAINCTFTNNNAYYSGGAIFGTAINCTFETSTDTINGETYSNLYFDNSNSEFLYGSGEKLLFDVRYDDEYYYMTVYGLNTSIAVYQNGKFLNNYYALSGEGWVVNLKPGIYTAKLSCIDYLNVDFKEITITITMPYVNVTSVTTNNKTVNITAKSNIPQDILEGELLFILPNTNPITANYAGNGIWWAVHTFDDYADYQVNATFAGLDNVTINNATITINKADSTLTVGDIVFDYGSSGSTTVSFDGASGVNASIVGQPNAKVSVDGNTITVSGLDVGTYTLTVTTIADADHNPVTRNATVTVNRAKTELTADAIITTYSVSKDLVITLKDSNDRPLSGLNITVDLNGTKNYTTDANGQVRIPTMGLAVNTYKVSITFNGTENYVNSSKTTTVTILKEAVKISTKPLTTTYNVHKYLVIALKDNNANPIRNVDATFTINGVTYKCRSDNKGDARLIIRLAPKTYTAKITFDNANYSHLIQYVKVTVLKAAPKLTAKKKTFKKAKKVKKYTVTLKDNNGKAMAKVKLTLKIKGKTYKAKTNAKGKATFKIKNLTKKGKYTAKITYKGNYLYKKATKKVKIVIK